MPRFRSGGEPQQEPSSIPAQLGSGDRVVRALLLRRLSAGPLGTVTAIEAIVHQDSRRPSNGATGGGRPLLLLLLTAASSGHAGVATARRGKEQLERDCPVGDTAEATAELPLVPLRPDH